MTDSIGAIGKLMPFEEGTIRIPVKGEELVVRKELVVVEEIVVTKERTIERQTITDTVRRQDVVVDDDGGEETGPLDVLDESGDQPLRDVA